MTQPEYERTESELASRIDLPTKNLDDFILQEELGRGVFSHVIRATDKTGRHEFALKLIRVEVVPGQTDAELAAMCPCKEARLCQLVSQEVCVVQCLTAFKTVVHDPASGVKMHLVVLQMPLMKGNMREWIQKQIPRGKKSFTLPEKQTLMVFIEMLNAVHKIHSHGVIHRDIKLENFMLDKQHMLRLADFGLSRSSDEVNPLIAGTPWTMSPASFLGVDDGFQGDWWSVGVVLYQTSQCGEWPFKKMDKFTSKEKTNRDTMEAGVKKAVLLGNINYPKDMPTSVHTILEGLLDPNPQTRYDINKVLALPCITEDLLRSVGRYHPPLRKDMEQLVALRAKVLYAGTHNDPDSEGESDTQPSRPPRTLRKSLLHPPGLPLGSPRLISESAGPQAGSNPEPSATPDGTARLEIASPRELNQLGATPREINQIGATPREVHQHSMDAIPAPRNTSFALLDGVAPGVVSDLLHGKVGLTKTRHRRAPSGDSLLTGEVDSARDTEVDFRAEPSIASRHYGSVGGMSSVVDEAAEQAGGRHRHAEKRGLLSRLKLFIFGSCFGEDDDYHHVAA